MIEVRHFSFKCTYLLLYFATKDAYKTDLLSSFGAAPEKLSDSEISANFAASMLLTAATVVQKPAAVSCSRSH